MWKKRLFCLFFVGSLITPHACLSSGNSEEEGRYSHYYKPSLISAVNNIFWGGACCLAAEVVHSDFNKNFGIPGQVGIEVGLGLGYKMIADGGVELLHWGYHRFKNYWYRTQNFPKLSPKEKFTSEDIRPLKVKKQDELVWNKTKNITRSFANTVFTVNFMRMCFMDEYYAFNKGLNPFSFNTDTCASGKLIDCHPIVLTGISFLAVTSVGYNLNELYESFKQEDLRQGDRPLIGAISGLSEVIIGAQAYDYYRPPQILTYVDSLGRSRKMFIGDVVGEYLHDFFVFHGGYQFYSNCLQMLKNIHNLVKSQPGLKVEKISLEKTSPSQVTVFVKKDRSRPVYYRGTGSDTASSQGIIEKSFQEEGRQLEDNPQQKIKVKRRGIADPSKSKASANNPPLETYKMRTSPAIEGERKEGLDKIKDLRKFNAVKQTYINALLSDTCKFLDGRISPVDGNEYAIVFYRGSQKISLKYEIPHGADGNVYKAYKLKRVLNAMETAYMYNWDEHSILNYMATNNISRFQQIPHNLLYILWTRPDL